MIRQWFTKALTWLDERIDGAVKRRFAFLESMIETSTQQALDRVADFDRQITEHIARLEADVLHVLAKSDCDRLNETERTALIRAAFRRAN